MIAKKIDRAILKNILRNRVCSNCGRVAVDESNIPIMCKRWMGEAAGWQWMEILEEYKTCKDWAPEGQR